MLRYYLLHLQRIQRPFASADATLIRLTAIYALKEEEDADEDNDVNLPAKLTTIDRVWVTIEDIDDYLVRKHGGSGVPLAYVVRPIIDLPDPLEDPGFGNPNYALEMIRRAPHNGAYYQRDAVAVWNVIRHVTHEGPAWSWVNSFVHTCGGRQAYTLPSSNIILVNRLLPGYVQMLIALLIRPSTTVDHVVLLLNVFV